MSIYQFDMGCIVRSDLRRLKGEATKEKLLNESLRLFAEKGYAGANVRAIAKAAGCNIGLIAFHFGGKEGLYKAALKRSCDNFNKHISPIILTLRSAIENGTEADLMQEIIISALIDTLNGINGKEELAGHSLMLLRDTRSKSSSVSMLTELLRPLMECVEEALAIITTSQSIEKAHVVSFLLINSVVAFLRDYPVMNETEEGSVPDTHLLTEILTFTIRSYFHSLHGSSSLLETQDVQ